MKKQFLLVILLLLGLMTPLQAQYQNSGSWKQIDSLLKLQLVKSAKIEINRLYSKALATDNYSDFIKALQYKSLLQVNKLNPNKFLTELKEEQSRLKFPQANILQSFIADFYHQYFRDHRWKIHQRTNIEGDMGGDIEDWSKQNFLDAASDYYLKSLQKQDSLYSIKIDEFKSILMVDSSSFISYPSLYDLLAQRAIRFFSTYPKSDKKLADEFLIPTKAFLNKEIVFEESWNYWLQVTRIYQTIAKLHSQNMDTNALVRSELSRLKWVHKKQIDKAILAKYLQILTVMTDEFESFKISTEIWYEIARNYANEGLKYRPYAKQKFRWDLKKAKEICELGVRNFQKSPGAKACKNLLKQIESPSLNLVLAKINLPDEPILSSLTYKNIKQLHFRLIKLSFLSNEKLNLNSNNHQLLKKYLIQSPLMIWSKKLPDEGDFQLHNLQFRIPELSLGSYVLLTSPDAKFHPDSLIQINKFYVSNLSFVSRNDSKGAIDAFILDRKKGNSVRGVKLELETMNYNQRESQWKLMKTIYSDKNGYLRILDLSRNHSYRAILSNGLDTLIQNNIYYSGSNRFRNNDSEIQTQLFTDRSIYRPGQTVYFKGVIYQKLGEGFKVLPSQQIEVELYDLNRQKLNSIVRTSNEFGSFNSSFVIPNSILNGRLQIRTKHGSTSINIEEYKRPGFEIKLDTSTKQYRLSDDIEVTGSASTFSGSPLTNAKGKFSVIRTYSPLYYKFNYNIFSEQKQIIYGEFQTDDYGNFKFIFNAIPDEKISLAIHPTFSYNIEIELSDLNGETHKARQIMRLAYADLRLLTDVKPVMNKDSQDLIGISAWNLRNQKQALNVGIGIFKLDEPDRAFKRRKWIRPDYFVTDQETFYTYFPNDQFDNENDVRSWPVDYQIFQAEINTGEVLGLQIEDMKNWPSGKYKLVLKARDDFDEEVEVEQFFTLYSAGQSSMPYPQIEFFVLEKYELNRGDTLRFVLGSSKMNVRALYELQYKNKVILSKWIDLNNSKQQFKYPINKNFKDEISLNVLFVVDNEVYNRNEKIKIIDPSRKLNIHLETFRPTLKPGNEEEWKIRISGNDKKALFAELLCSMYDASLDHLKSHSWIFRLSYYFRNQIAWNIHSGFVNNFGLKYNQRHFVWQRNQLKKVDLRYHWEVMATRAYIKSLGANTIEYEAEIRESIAQDREDKIHEPMDGEEMSLSQMEARGTKVLSRKNFNETTFFYPSLKTDKDGNINIKFTSPESLTRWKFMALAHTKDLRIAQLTQEVITQKELMVSPNIPRFFREGDTIYFNTKIISLSDETISGETSLEIFNAQNMKPVKGILLDNSVQTFEVPAKSSVSKQWKLYIPEGINAIVYRLIATSKNHGDGEERIIPVLPSKILVTESLPIYLNPKEENNLTLQNLVNSARSESLVHHKLKFEMTTNPAWYAVLALPKIAEGKREDAISMFNRFYSNTMANHLLHTQPQIKQIFDVWNIGESDALTSQLEKNQELKSVLLQETPWVFDAKNESEQRKKLAQFFDHNQITHGLSMNLDKLLENQLPNGSWSWFKGMNPSRYITQQIVNGLVRLQEKEIIDQKLAKKINQPLKKALNYLNQKLVWDYQKIKNNKDIVFGNDHLRNIQIQHLFTLSFSGDIKDKDEDFTKALAYFFSQEQKYWMKRTPYMQGMIALTLFRNGDHETAKLILKSLKERSTYNEELGVYWVTANAYYWYQAPIETQALLIEAFAEIENELSFVNELKKWLLNQKRTQMWSNAKASVEAVNALMSGNNKLLSTQLPVQTKIGKRKIESSNQEAGTGFYTKSWSGNEINANMGQIHLKNENTQMAWGAMHWQYFEQLDSIVSSEGSLNIEKKLFIKENSGTAEVLVPIDEREIKIGDKVVSRIIVTLDRNMDFVHINDMRAPAFEPIQVLSGYRYRSGIGFYQSVSDLATHYYFDNLRAGTYVFENEMFVTQKGTFSNGISTIECLYAPEFSSHSEGVKVIINN